MALLCLETLEEAAKESSSAGRFINPSKTEGERRMRFIGAGITGWLGWNTDNKPERFEQKPSELPANIKVDPGAAPLKRFFANLVYDFETDEFKIFEWTQKTITEQVHKFMKDEDYGDPTLYDIKLSRTGEGLKTEYSVVAAPPKPVTKAVQDRYDNFYCNLDALYDGGDPFSDPTA
jgi:hypothetical protein